MAVETFTVSASGKYSIIKDPNAVLDYTFDWTAWLAAASTPADKILTATCTVTGSVTAAVDSIAFDDQKVTAWISGGAVGDAILLRCRITTENSPARIEDRSVTLKVKER